MILCNIFTFTAFFLIGINSFSPAFASSHLDQGAFTPEAILPKGVDTSNSINPYTGESGNVRKGTIAATIYNVALLNTALTAPSTEKNQQQINQLIEEILRLIPSLKVVAMFDLFTPGEWMTDKTQPGRILTALLYLQKYPKKITSENKTQIQALHQSTHIKEIKDIIDQLRGKKLNLF